MLRKIESMFETALWQSRLIVILAVLCSLVAAIAMFYVATIDAYIMVIHLGAYADPDLEPAARSIMRATTVTHVVEIVDGYLMATVMLIFALGLYELFISNIEAAENSETASNVMIVHSLDDLKSRLAKVILMILIVRFFENAIRMHFETALDLLYLAGSIALIGLALYLSHEKDTHGKAD
jgi:uncharacterized membrane protein YqhA